MARLVEYTSGALLDVGTAVALLVNWLAVSLIVDATSEHDENSGTRKGASLWLLFSSLGLTTLSTWRSFRIFGDPNAATKAPETVLGVFSEIVAWAETWGVCFLAARTWSLPDDHAFHTNHFLHNVGNSVFEMSLVQAGVGWAADPPATFSERVVAWAAAYIGGVLITNLYLLSIVLTRRGWWTLPVEPVPIEAPTGMWQFSSIVK